jgi:hypothetical protein
VGLMIAFNQVELRTVTMTGHLQADLQSAVRSGRPVEEIVTLLRSYKAQGATQDEVYSLLVKLREQAADEATEDRLLEIADFVAGFCSPHMKIWDN